MTRKPTVLVVDDSPAVMTSLTLLLQHFGYSSVAASCGPEALHLASTVAVDIAIVDVNLPGIDGVTTAVEICKKLQSCKVILHSGDPESTEVFERAKRNGN